MPPWESQALIPGVFNSPVVKLKSKIDVILFPMGGAFFGHQNHKVRGLDC